MNVIYSVKDYVSNVFHQDSGSGAIDIVAVQQADGFIQCSPFHVYFGSLPKLKPYEHQHVSLEVNGHKIHGIHMKVDPAGEVYFVHQVLESIDEQDYSILPHSPSSIGLEMDTIGNNNAFCIEKKTVKEPQGHGEDATRESKRQRVTTHGLNAALSILDEENTSEEDEEVPGMVKCASVYFDAVDIEVTMAASGKYVDYYYDHPSMSLCGHLLDTVVTKSDVYRIFLENVITFDYFQANAASILANPALRFYVDGKVTSYDADMQAYLVSRVLFPYSQHLSVGASPSRNVNEPDVSMELQTVDAISRVVNYDERLKISKYTFSHSGMLERGSTTLEQLDEVCSDDAGSTQDTASITSESYFNKSLKPSQEELLEMGLRIGTNDISFVLQLDGVGEVARVTANLYLWPVTTKVVIAQIDGAILSKAATGSMFKRRDPAAMHPGAVEFYSKLARNGYRVVYITSHGILQAQLHQALLHNSAGEDGDVTLPMGPVLFSPDRLLASYNKEINGAQGFRFTVLDDLQSLFPRCVNPFYAAFGTTQADSVMFMQAGVFPGKVFIIDPADGVLRHRSLMGFHESYTSLLDRVDVMFPPIYSPTTVIPRSEQSSAQSVARKLQSVSSNLSSTSCASMVKDNQHIAFEAVASLVRTRSLTDEAYNDINFWRLQPGYV
ncbi:unnamed protein product [Peronospora belbahrii]|uniref:LNS2/PITP domain-containing protein n=1 Tax=Peronospora belbahrii TaxID=622444 RepID=A0AAU9KQI7_9STRA|nr:unnamed protein product [Peronospora belbahrii]CAH0517658.1 unnamed protein product [Peronospora belbahrii]